MSTKFNDLFHKIPEQELRKIIAESTSMRQVLYKMNATVAGCQSKLFKRIIKELNIDISHFKGEYKLGEKFKTEIPPEKTFVNGKFFNGRDLTKKIIKYNLKKYKCEKCGNTGTWMGEPIVLQLDHIDGKNTNNCLENLRFMCPNCHSQTSTYSGRRHRKINLCPDCGNQCHKKSKKCRKCASRTSIEKKRNFKKVIWPELEIIRKAVFEKPLSILSKEWSCSDVGLKKYCVRNNIELPPKNYWLKRI